MNIFKKLSIRAALGLISSEHRELVRLLRANKIMSAGFDTKYGHIAIPVNSRSIIESFLAGEYFGSVALQSFLNHKTKSRRLLNIGANVGTSARMIACSEKYQKIYCFEPDPNNFRLLQANFLNNNAVSLHNVAVGAENGQLSLNLNPLSVGRHSFKTDFGLGAIDVSIVRLDDFIADNEPFDLFMDVEGWEIEVLRGATSSMRNCNLFALEWNGQLHSREERLAMIELVRSAGFTKMSDLNTSEHDLEIDDLEKLSGQRDVVFLRK
ncbi:hypothetical protein B6V75_18170 [Thioclava sp. F1Mire-8]|uniref:FkbM family methyltransferase n=1 Tax=Thioclava sp. F1Mire-8 TaxID=1973006 RepID=UPI000B53D992|nr:FkbM family methyltransferase [Thioclava sp. F1Mire-8]OWX99675.1 hypothetical protein B6V75_18170 [Thioclava sp. F1Mire-8]